MLDRRDIAYVAGAALVGYGLWQWFPPLLWVYAGCLLVGFMVYTNRPPRETG